MNYQHSHLNSEVDLLGNLSNEVARLEQAINRKHATKLNTSDKQRFIDLIEISRKSNDRKPLLLFHDFIAAPTFDIHVFQYGIENRDWAVRAETCHVIDELCDKFSLEQLIQLAAYLQSHSKDTRVGKEIQNSLVNIKFLIDKRQEDSLKFGLISVELYHDLCDKDWRIRSKSMDQFLSVCHSDLSAHSIDYSKLSQLLSKLASDDNFHVSLTAIKAVVCLVQQFGKKSAPFLKTLIDILISKLSSKTCIRQACQSSLLQIIQLDPPVIFKIIINAARLHVTPQICDLISAALLKYGNSIREHISVLSVVKAGILQSVKTKYHAIEMFACFAHFYHGELAVRFEEYAINEEESLLLSERIADPRLPYLNEKNGLEHIYEVNSKLQHQIPLITSIESPQEQSNIVIVENSPEANDAEDEIDGALDNLIKLAENIIVPVQKPVKKKVEIRKKPLIKNPVQEPALETAETKLEAVSVSNEALQTDSKVVLTLEKQLKDLFLRMKSDDWEVISKALEAFDALEINESTFLVENINELSNSLLNHVQNLRSSVSKLAILNISKLVSKFPKQMEACIENVISCVQKKVGEGNNFIIEEIDKLLDNACKLIRPPRLISGFLVDCSHRNPVVRKRTSIFLDKIISAMTIPAIGKLISSKRDTDKLIVALGLYIKEGLSETRNAAKHALYCLSSAPIFAQSLPKLVNAGLSKEIMDMLALYSIKSDKPASDTEKRMKQSKQKLTIDDEQQGPGDFHLNLSSEDWQTRHDAITNIKNYITSNPTNFQKINVRTLFDIYSQRCGDGNSKVALNAITSLTEMFPVFGLEIEPVLAQLIPILMNQSISSNSSIRSATQKVFEVLFNNVDSVVIFQIISSIAQFGGNSKLRCSALIFLTSGLQCNQKSIQLAIPKYIIPCAISIFVQSKIEMQKANNNLLVAVHQKVGKDFYDGVKMSISPDTRRKIAKLLLTSP